MSHCFSEIFRFDPNSSIRSISSRIERNVSPNYGATRQAIPVTCAQPHSDSLSSLLTIARRATSQLNFLQKMMQESVQAFAVGFRVYSANGSYVAQMALTYIVQMASMASTELAPCFNV